MLVTVIAMVMRTALAVLVMVLSFLSSVVMRAVLAVFVMELSFLSSVVVRAVLAVLVMVLGAFRGVVVVTACTMHVAGVVVDREFRGVGHGGQEAK